MKQYNKAELRQILEAEVQAHKEYCRGQEGLISYPDGEPTFIDSAGVVYNVSGTFGFLSIRELDKEVPVYRLGEL